MLQASYPDTMMKVSQNLEMNLYFSLAVQWNTRVRKAGHSTLLTRILLNGSAESL